MEKIIGEIKIAWNYNKLEFIIGEVKYIRMRSGSLSYYIGSDWYENIVDYFDITDCTRFYEVAKKEAKFNRIAYLKEKIANVNTIDSERAYFIEQLADLEK